jgi:hypothetical protein
MGYIRVSQKDEVIHIFKAYFAICKWLRLEHELDHIQVYRQAVDLCKNVIRELPSPI